MPIFNDARLRLREAIALGTETVLARPTCLHRMVFKCLRTRWPILVIGRFAFVSRYEDVCKVLADGEHFSVVYEKKVRQTTGPYVVGMGNSMEYRQMLALIHAAAPRYDQPAIRTIVRNRADHLVSEASAHGRIDLVAGLARDVGATFVREYLGVYASRERIMRWSRAIFREIFVDFGNDPEIGAKAQRACVELKDCLDALIEQRAAQIQRGEPAPDDFLCRLLRYKRPQGGPLPRDLVYRIVAGTLVAPIDNCSNFIANVADFLLDHPGRMEDARRAALAGDDPLLMSIALEALRFYPQNPFLLRRCRKSLTLAPWTDRATLIPANTLVLAGTASAMFDATQFRNPDEFRTNRDTRSFLHFGHLMHECFGAFIASMIIPETIKALLRHGRVHRVRGRAGRIRYDGAFADHFFVEFS